MLFKTRWAIGIQMFNHFYWWSYEVEKPMFQGELSAIVIRFACFSVFIKWLPALEVAKKVIKATSPAPGFRGYRG